MFYQMRCSPCGLCFLQNRTTRSSLSPKIGIVLQSSPAHVLLTIFNIPTFRHPDLKSNRASSLSSGHQSRISALAGVVIENRKTFTFKVMLALLGDDSYESHPND